MFENLTRAEYDALLRQDFCDLCRALLSRSEPQAAFATNWHIEVIAAKLARCVRARSAACSSTCRRGT
jgi:DICT domain-containing protein